MYDIKETDASFTEASAPINSIICPAYPVNSNSIPIKIFYFLSLIRLSTIIDVSDSFLIAFYIRFYIRLATFVVFFKITLDFVTNT